MNTEYEVINHCKIRGLSSGQNNYRKLKIIFLKHRILLQDDRHQLGLFMALNSDFRDYTENIKE